MIDELHRPDLAAATSVVRIWGSQRRGVALRQHVEHDFDLIGTVLNVDFRTFGSQPIVHCALMSQISALLHMKCT